MYHILVADDEARIRSIIRKYAEFEGHTVTEAGDGMEAVHLCRNGKFDIVVLDIMMPELDGFSACREIRKITDTPIIMLSARGEEYDRINGFECGADDYVVKPFSPRELMLRVEAVMKRVTHKAQEAASQNQVMFPIGRNNRIHPVGKRKRHRVIIHSCAAKACHRANLLCFITHQSDGSRKFLLDVLFQVFRGNFLHRVHLSIATL